MPIVNPENGPVTESPDHVVERIVAEYRADTASAPWLVCDRHPVEKVAFRFVDADLGVTEITYGELAIRSRRAARFLAERGVGQGDRVASLMGKGPDLPALILGIWRLGAVYVPLFTAFAADAIADRIADAGVMLVVTDVQQHPKVRQVPVQVVLDRDPAAGAGFGDALESGPEWTAPTPVSGGEIPIVQMATSGTTGKPKVVVHPLAYAAGWQAYIELGLAAGHSYWCAADPGWAYGLYTAIIGPLAAGVPSIIATGTFKPEQTWRILAELAVTDFAAAPTALRALRASDPGVDLPALQRISSAGEPLTPEVGQWTRERFGLDVHDHFGQTELGMPAGFAHHPDLERSIVPRAMGTAFPGWAVLVLRADSDEPAPTGQVGRLAIDVAASPLFTFTGYGATRDLRGTRFTASGSYYLTGDLASVDEDGVIHFSSRDDDVILMAGYRIGPFDIESVLVAHPSVAECAVVATPDEVRGEVIHAYIVPATTPEDPDALADDLRTWVRTRYGAHAFPRLVTFVDALPKTPSGKIQRVALRSPAGNERIR
ncbi:AMP-binding protein [Rhodococcus sp. B50]|uniref:AMP-binding protein n=1 Tax=Rhodococcus sp. B50 TaxID=2682847 RepID=UPI001BD3E0C3|nr:AMP-binding protein [Rhodococcus sp. B50]MBS9376486.1 Acetyl-coenzyme A synthetase [Rhodococcus sp. B50]